MGTVKKAGKAGVRSVANRSPSTPKKRATARPEATQEATEAQLNSINNEFRKCLALLAPGADLDEQISTLPDHQLSSLATFYHSRRDCALIHLRLLGKLLGHVDAVQLEAHEVSAIGWHIMALAEEAECTTELGDFAEYALSKRAGGAL